MYGFVKILLFNFHRLPLYGIYNLIYSKKKNIIIREKKTNTKISSPSSRCTENWELRCCELSLSIPDSTNSCTPVPATRGYRGALYKFSMNHWQWNLQMETGPNVTQFLQVSITLHRFLGAPSVFSKQRWFGGRCTMAQKKGGKEKRRRAKYMHQGL